MPSAYLPDIPGWDTLPEKYQTALREEEEKFDIPTERLKDILAHFLSEFRDGLAKAREGDNANAPFLPMIPSFLRSIPNGTETGTYLALDLGGTNLRVCEVTLFGDHKWKMKQQKYRVSDRLKEGDVTQLMDYIAGCIDTFITANGTSVHGSDGFIPLGFTFSFPVAQTAIAEGTLISWTKGFECRNAIGHDVVQLLQDALLRKHIHVKCVALVNDTCGTLMTKAYEHGSCLCGAIFGTGTNGAYVEDAAQILKQPELASDHADLRKMVVNTEWGAFDNSRAALKFSIYDSRVDRISINPRKQAFEKMISGMYLGEITRNVLIHLVDAQVLFNGYSCVELNRHYGLDTAAMSAFEEYKLPHSTKTPVECVRATLLSETSIDPQLVEDADCIAIARVSEIVGTRSARLSACAIAATVVQTGFDKSTEEAVFGLDGSLIEFYPLFVSRIKQALVELLGQEVTDRISIGLAKDGSGVGAALCAQSALRQAQLEAK